MDRISSLTILIITAFLYSLTIKFRGDAGMFPKALLIAITVLSLLLFLSSFIFPKMKKDGEKKQSVGFFSFLKRKREQGIHLFVFAASTVIYVFIIPLFGFYFSTFIFMGVSFLYCGMKNKVALVLTPLLSCIFLYLVFTQWLSVQVPAGMFI
ncbi:MAG: tripartite tricarboxylate transporter TctB family protein [Desulfovibrio sp.]|jgi:hypothetical protein|nr:tripartite tricarboxylate transporter TctB family protein [Desulfovibrio sp.]